MPTKIDLSKVEAIIKEVASVEIMPRFRKLADHDVEMKGINDPVTVADKESERHLTERLQDYLPHSLVVGEESFAKDKSIMAHLSTEHPIWIIDPIDGTRNFVAGVPEFAVMIALVQQHHPIASWIHDPNSGDTIMAEEGAGVWLEGSRLMLATSDPRIATVGVVGSRVKQLISDPNVIPQNDHTPVIEIGSCAGFDYPRLFTGAKTFAHATSTRASFLFYKHTNAWDHMPGMFLHKEGGGYCADWSGNPYNMNNPLGGLLYAPTKEKWLELYKFFEPLMHHTSQKIP